MDDVEFILHQYPYGRLKAHLSKDEVAKLQGLSQESYLTCHASQLLVFRKSFRKRDGFCFLGGNVLGDKSWETPLDVLSEIVMECTDAQANQDKYRLMAENMSDLLAIVDAKGIVKYASPSHTRLLGMNPDKCVGQSVFDSVHPEDRQTVQITFIEMVQSKKIKEIEFRYISQLDREIYVEAIGTPLCNESGEVTNVITVARNITRRRQAETALVISEQRFRSLFENNPDAVYATDIAGRFVACNQACEKLTGYRTDEILGQNFYPFTSVEDYELVMADFLKIRQGQTRDIDSIIIHKEGYRIAVNVTVMPITVDGEIVGAFGMVKNITEKKAAMVLLRAQNTIFDLISTDASLEEVLNRIAETVKELSPNKLCSIMVFDQDGGRQLYGANPPLPNRYLECFDGTQSGSANYSFRSAAHAKQTIIVTDIETDTLWEQNRDEALSLGVRACWARPITNREAKVLGTFAVYSNHPGPLLEHDLEIMDVFSHVTGVAILKDRDKQEIKRLVYHDVLTEVPNQRFIAQRFEQERKRADEEHAEIAIVCFNFDDFHSINRELGHFRANEYLKAVILKAQDELKELGMVARIGGEPFAVMIPGVNIEQSVMQAAEIIRQIVSNPVYIDGLEIYSTVSLGAAVYPKDGTDLSELLRNAETAMDEVKHNGKNHIRFFRPPMDAAVHERIKLVKDIHRALLENQFFLCYQPRVDVMSWEVTSCEALIRWNHPERGFMSPTEFIPICEETGLIVEVGQWVVREVCRQIAAWSKVGYPPIRIAVNFSPRQFQQGDLVGSVRDMLRESGVSPDLIEVEITESTLMIDDTDVSQKLRQLREMGMSISIDDFGTGYSSIGFLKRFPLDCVKIDQSFVRDITKDKENAAIARTIIQLAHDLGMKVVAEGVETIEQQEFLQANGCREAQGFLYCKPLPADEFRSFLYSFV